jgi:hypothetical protein
MLPESEQKKQELFLIKRLKKMGGAFLLLSILNFLGGFLISFHFISKDSFVLIFFEKQTFYALAGIFLVMGTFCWGAIWQKKMFIK